jgi:hypothetical protein
MPPIRGGRPRDAVQLQKTNLSRSAPILPPTTPSRFDRPLAEFGKTLTAPPPALPVLSALSFPDAYKLAKQRASQKNLQARGGLLPSLSATAESFRATNPATGVGFCKARERPLTQMWRGKVLRNIPNQQDAEEIWELEKVDELKPKLVSGEAGEAGEKIVRRRRVSIGDMGGESRMSSKELNSRTTSRRESIESGRSSSKRSCSEADLDLFPSALSHQPLATRRRSDIRLGSMWSVDSDAVKASLMLSSWSSTQFTNYTSPASLEVPDVEHLRIGFKRFHLPGDPTCFGPRG